MSKAKNLIRVDTSSAHQQGDDELLFFVLTLQAAEPFTKIACSFEGHHYCDESKRSTGNNQTDSPKI
jgi:hypothetical protein